ncbi:MAG: hypothetical protein KME16_14365 [Scytolyngbya sp. HA4215-MV1]|nr:hypothetical protein [Scytolyngbya sp. HA4215-MV1]
MLPPSQLPNLPAKNSRSAKLSVSPNASLSWALSLLGATNDWKLLVGRWLILLVIALLPIGVGMLGLSMLLKLPEFSSCNSIQIDESPSLRLYCAQKLASDKTPENLLDAIRLVEGLPNDHALHAQGDRLARQWSLEILELAEATFQQGKKEDAVATARQIPLMPEINRQINDRVAQWESIWSKAEMAYEDAENAIDQSQWSDAFGSAKQLLNSGNEYWATTRYEELMEKIRIAREDSDNKPKTAKRRKSNSPEDVLARWRQEQETEELTHLKKARVLASTGDAKNLSAAIDEANQVYGSQYKVAQMLVSNWSQQLEMIEDRPHLTRAMSLAAKGDVTSLQAAISEANQIDYGRSLYEEARGKIEQWTSQMQQLQLQPELEPILSGPSATSANQPHSASSPAPNQTGNNSGFSPVSTQQPLP